MEFCNHIVQAQELILVSYLLACTRKENRRSLLFTSKVDFGQYKTNCFTEEFAQT